MNVFKSWPETPRLAGEIIRGFMSIDASAWPASSANNAEGARYHSALEATAAQDGTVPAAVAVRDRDGIAAAAPLFNLCYRIDTPFQGMLGAWVGWLAERLPRLFGWELLGVGSPLADHCHLALREDLPETAHTGILGSLIDAVEAEAQRRQVALIAFKDLAPQQERALGPLLAERGYARITSLPLAVVEVGASEDAYLARLSSATRKDIRRKLKQRGAIRVERRTTVSGLETEIAALYRSTSENSRLRYGEFEDLPTGYFEQVSRALGEDAVFHLYWVGDQLAAFNLLLVGADRVVDKFLGMAYPVAKEHNLYVVSWMENLRFCRDIGRGLLQTGQTAYAPKLRLGSYLEPSAIYAKHTNGLLNRGLRAIAPWLAFDRWDPDLRAADIKEVRPMETTR